MSAIDSKINLTEKFMDKGSVQPRLVEVDLADIISLDTINDGYGDSLTRLVVRTKDAHDVLLVTDKAEDILKEWDDFKEARNHEAAGNSTLESKPLPAETVPPEWIKSFA